MNLLNKVIVFSFLFVQFHNGYSQSSKQTFKSQLALGEIIDKQLSEISGITYATQSSYFWVHNDSGDGARIYLIDKECKLLCDYELEAIDVKDCEDMARVIISGKPYLILADIGDNRAIRTHIKLYIFPEPIYKSGDNAMLIAKKEIRTVTLRYSDGPRDAEALFIDPKDRQLYVISKRDFQSTVYKAVIFNDLKKNNALLSPIIKLPFTFVTSADISTSGDEILIKNLTEIFYWKRNRNESVEHTLSKKPTSIPYQVEPQGEAITFGGNEEGFYTISERPFGLKSYLYFFEKR
ncbi:hypothetical protein [Sphingobacterium faecium]|uniref:hypothetical protein n=1 Tax=Sphingobacterium faecium TaxID=34087 RepID=UPI00246851AC|nr:hypothetical protein [Sphingobacterium faecium]MDH5827279.1 hypothetical protein [Sphingobacterium faecium]